MNFSFFIAKRIIGGRKSRFSRPAVRIAIAGVAAGLAMMIVTLSIVRGFQNSIRDKVEGFDSDIQISNYDINNSLEPAPIIVRPTLLDSIKKIKEVKHIQVYITKNGIIKSKDENEGVILKGVGSDYDWSFIQYNLQRGKVLDVKDSSLSSGVLISSTIANEMKTDTGAKLTVFFVSRTKDTDANGQYNYEQRVKTFIVKGIYQTGLEEFDRDLFLWILNNCNP
jgi:lipoprotein-releasing system permease protein